MYAVEKPTTGTLAEELNNTTPTAFYFTAVRVELVPQDACAQHIAQSATCMQLVSPLPEIAGPSAQVALDAVSPTVIIRMTNVNITCNALVTRPVPPQLPIPMAGQTFIVVESIQELLDALSCEPPCHVVACWLHARQHMP